MVYGIKPYRTFQTLNELTISVGQTIKFETIDGDKVEGLLIGATAKAVEINKYGELNSEKWLLADILEESMKVL